MTDPLEQALSQTLQDLTDLGNAIYQCDPSHIQDIPTSLHHYVEHLRHLKKLTLQNTALDNMLIPPQILTSLDKEASLEKFSLEQIDALDVNLQAVLARQDMLQFLLDHARIEQD